MIYQLWMSKASSRAEKALAQQTEAEREADGQALIAAHVESGARPLILCESGWANEEHPFWGVTAFPDLESRVKLYRMMNAFGYYQRHEPSFSILGTPMEEPRLASIKPGLIYSLWMVKTDPSSSIAYKALTEEEKKRMWETAASHLDRLGGCWVLRCNSYWANDAYFGWGCEAFPTLEAFQEYKAELSKINWEIYIHGSSILGTLHPWQQQFATIFR